jgi:hypothetical protein
MAILLMPSHQGTSAVVRRKSGMGSSWRGGPSGCFRLSDGLRWLTSVVCRPHEP